MKKYTVEFNPEAKLELLGVYDYIFLQLENPISADRTIAGIIKKCRQLELFPKASPVRIKISGKSFRYTHFGNYTIAYLVDDSKMVVTIYNITYSHRDLTSLLKNKSDS